MYIIYCSFFSEGADYISISEIVNFQSGETLKNVPITILDDSYVEGTEYFILKIESMEGDVIYSISEAVVAIQDDDGKKNNYLISRNISVLCSAFSKIVYNLLT